MLRSFLRPREGYLIAFQLLALVATVFAITQGFGALWWLIGILGYVGIFGLGITVTFHRMLAHRSYKLAKPLEYLFSLFANLGCTGSSVGWVFVHRAHHEYTDKPGDPHSPVVLGRWGAITGQYGGAFNKWLVRDVINDPIHRVFHDYHLLFLIAYALVPLLLLGLPGFLFIFAVPVFLNTFVSRMSNWIDHEPRFGRKEHQNGDASHNVWWWSIIALGEGWHNNHHAQAGDYRFGRKWWQIDFGLYVIAALMAVGLASKIDDKDDWRRE